MLYKKLDAFENSPRQGPSRASGFTKAKNDKLVAKS